jgi:Lrp/AsnC family transcriptional regulator, leucine-responsive regulatory protein
MDRVLRLFSTRSTQHVFALDRMPKPRYSECQVKGLVFVKASKQNRKGHTNLKLTPVAQPNLDDTDWAILRLLQDDARLSFSEMGRRVHLSQPAVAERVHVLEERGIITGYHASVNPYKLGFPILAFIHVAARTVPETAQASEVIQDIPEILECHRITGIDGMILKAIAPSIERLDEIIHDIARVSAPTTSVVLGTDFTRRTI